MPKLKKGEFPKHFQITLCVTGAASHVPAALVSYKQPLGWEQFLEAAEHTGAPDQSCRHEPMREVPVNTVSVAFIFLSD